MHRFVRLGFVLVVLTLLALQSYATVTITTATGAVGVSADKASGSISPSFTGTGDIIISSNAAADFATGSGLTFTLSVPTNWQFRAGVGSAVGAGSITVTNVVVTGSTVTVTFNNLSANVANKITVSGLSVQASVKTALTSASITRASGGATIAGFATGTVVGSVSAVAGAFVKLQLLLTGEVTAPGTVSGKTGTPAALSSGTASNVTVNAVDANWNRVTTATDVINITTTDANSTALANAALASGTKTFSVTLRTLGSATTVTATDITDGTKTANTSPAVTVNIGAFSKMQILLPGETAAPGTTAGKTGTPTQPIAGNAFNVTVNAVDAGWNVITSITDNVTLSSTTDVNAVFGSNPTALVAGSATISATFKTAGTSKSIIVTHNPAVPPAKTANTSTTVTVLAGAFVKLQILFPGEVAAAGSATGKTAALPTALTSGVAVSSITVNAVDANWNKVTSTDNVQVTINDANGTNVAAAVLASGVKTFKPTFRTVTTTATATAIDLTDPSKTAATSPNITVNAGAFTKLLVVLPGETFAPSTSTGKTGTATTQVAGTPFDVTVYATDAGFNLIASATDEINITTTDVNNTLPANANLVAGVQTFSITLKTALVATSGKTIKATDITNAARTAYTTAKIGVNPGTFTKLLTLLSGEVFAGGTSTGKTAALPVSQKAGVSVNSIKVYAVDAYFNIVNTATDNIALTTSDPNVTLPANRPLVAGTTTFTVTFKTLGSQTVTVTDVTDGTKTSYVSAAFTVTQGTFTKLLILMPGETFAPGTSTGKTGTATPATAGTPFNVTVYGVDAVWNVVTTVTDVVRLASSDVNATLPPNTTLASGAATLSVTLKAAGAKTVTVTDITSGTKTASIGSISINPGAYSKLLIKLPGESFVPGSATGKSGTANTGARGIAFNLTVNAVDNYFNLVNTVTNTVTLTSSDGTATLPPPAALVAGTVTFTGVNILDESTTPLPTLTATDAAITTTVDVPLGTTPTLTTDYFRTQASGDWNNVATWESSQNGSTLWQDATITPTNAANIVTVRNTHVVTVTSSVTVDQVVVEADGEVDINAGITLTLSSAAGGTALDVNGILKNAGTIGTTGALVFENASTYQHNLTSSPGSIPTATWSAVSTCEVIGYTSAAGVVGGTNQTFSNFVWNCPGQSSNLSLGGTSNMNNFTVLSTGSGTLQLGSTGGTVTVRGDFDLEDGQLIVNNTSGTQNLNINGDFAMMGGNLQRGSGTSNVRFAGSNTQNFLKTGGIISGAVNFIINANAVVDFGDAILDGSASTFTLTAGGSILTDNDLGFTASGSTGSIQVGGTRTYSTAGNYTFNGSSAQIAGSGLPTTVNNLTINNAGGVTLPSGTFTYTIDGVLNLNGGDLDMGTNRLLAGTSFTTSGTGILKTQNTSATPIPTGKTWTVGIEYNGAAGQTVVPGNYANLAFSQAGTKTAASGTLNVTGDWSSADGKVDLITNNVAVTFTGINQTLTDDDSDGGDGIIFKNVTMGNSGVKTLSSGSFSISSQGLLTMSGTASLASNGNLTLLSDATGTGSVGPLSSAGIITGNVHVQRFITGGSNLTYRGYRLISSPISVPSASNTYYDFSYLRGSGTYLTGAGGASKGFDVAGNATLYLYREDKAPNNASFTAGNYRAVTAINNSPTYNLSTIDGDFNMPVGNGFLFFFRGNNSTNPSTPPSDIILSSLGTLNQGQIVVKNWFNYSSGNLAYSNVSGSTAVQGFNLVGNPYPSTIDWNTAFNGTATSGIYAPNTDQTIYIYNAVSKNYATYLNTSATAGIGTNNGSRYIPSGQGFFVHATNASAQMVFNESAKANSNPGTLLLNAATPAINPQIRLLLAKDSINKDENVLVFNNNAQNAYIENEDALYLKGSGVVSLSHLSTDDKVLAIDQLPFPKKTQQIPLSVAVNSAGGYQLSLAEISNIPAIYDIWLKDTYLNDSLDIKHHPTYDFTVSANTATSGANRFQLIIRPNPALAVHLLNFTAIRDIDNVKLSWTAENEANHTTYVVEHSADGGKTFTTLDSLTSIGQGTYHDLDPHPVKGQNYYRLKQTDLMGNVIYSPIVKVMYAEQSNNQLANNLINIYPNPATSTLNLTVTKPKVNAAASYKIVISNSNGVIVRSITSPQPTWQGDISLLMPGSYFVQVTDLKDNSTVGRSSFIKL
jgi:hypothetical protein